MSAQKLPRRGIFGAIIGMLGFSVIAGVLVTAMVTPAIAVTGVTATSTIGIFDSLPEYIEIGAQAQKNEIYAVTGVDAENNPTFERIATTFGDQNREEVGADRISDFILQATLAGEDRRFHEHGGVDLPGVVRAAVNNAMGGDLEGASTLTMQLVKNLEIQKCFSDPGNTNQDEINDCIGVAQETTVNRKLKEMKLAIGLEKRYTKEEILLAYLNIAGFGGTTYGIEAAAQRYYGVSALDVTLAQAASLIAIVQEPSARNLSRVENYEANQSRRDIILGNMRVEGYIDQTQLEEARATPVDETTVVLTDPQSGCGAGHPYARYACDYVVKSIKDLTVLGATEAERLANWKIGGYKVYTSLDFRLQPVAQDTIMAQAPADETRFQLGASTTSVETNTGRILTMAQNKHFNEIEGSGSNATSVNFNTDRPYGGSRGFQTGSTYKLFTLINWLETGHGLNEVVLGNARTINMSGYTDSCNGPHGGQWKFRNSAGEAGSFSVMNATARSINGAYASMALQLDLCDIKRAAEKMGVHTADHVDNPNTTIVENELGTNPGSILGDNAIAPLTMASAYATVANGGIYCKPTIVDNIVDARGNSLGGQKTDCAQVLDPEVAATAAYALQGAMRGYASNDSSVPMMGKTGTTDSSNQTWLVAATTRVTTAIWFGNIVGDYSISRYPGGTSNRHIIGRTIFANNNAVYGGDAFPAPADRLLVGAGVEVGNYIGTSPEIARSAIEGAGLTYVDGGDIDSDLPVGVVAQTTPGAGTIVAKGMEVTVIRSRGNQAVVPDVVTSKPSYNSARSTLNSAGFSRITEGCEEVQPTDANLNRVMASDPVAGTPWLKTEEIELTVGKLSCD